MDVLDEWAMLLLYLMARALPDLVVLDLAGLDVAIPVSQLSLISLFGRVVVNVARLVALFAMATDLALELVPVAMALILEKFPLLTASTSAVGMLTGEANDVPNEWMLLMPADLVLADLAKLTGID